MHSAWRSFAFSTTGDISPQENGTATRGTTEFQHAPRPGEHSPATRRKAESAGRGKGGVEFRPPGREPRRNRAPRGGERAELGSRGRNRKGRRAGTESEKAAQPRGEKRDEKKTRAHARPPRHRRALGEARSGNRGERGRKGGRERERDSRGKEMRWGRSRERLL